MRRAGNLKLRCCFFFFDRRIHGAFTRGICFRERNDGSVRKRVARAITNWIRLQLDEVPGWSRGHSQATRFRGNLLDDARFRGVINGGYHLESALFWPRPDFKPRDPADALDTARGRFTSERQVEINFRRSDHGIVIAI